MFLLAQLHEPIQVWCQESHQKPLPMQYPDTIARWTIRSSIGVSSIAMPTDIAQEAASIHWPLFHFDAVMGLPRNFLLEGIVSTEIVTNHFKLLGRWVVEFTDKLHAEIGIGWAYWFGQLKQFEFNNTIHGWFTYPRLGIGYDFGSFALTLQGELSYINSVSTKSGSMEASSSERTFNGFSYRVALEQPFWKSTGVGLAFQMNYLKFYYPSWPLFPTFSRYFWIPEAQIWLTL